MQGMPPTLRPSKPIRVTRLCTEISAMRSWCDRFCASIVRGRSCILPRRATWTAPLCRRKHLFGPMWWGHLRCWSRRARIGRNWMRAVARGFAFCTCRQMKCMERWARTIRRSVRPRLTRRTVPMRHQRPGRITWHGRISTPTDCRCSPRIARTTMGRFSFRRS